MNKVRVRLVDPSHGKIVTKTFQGLNALELAIVYLQRMEERARAE